MRKIFMIVLATGVMLAIFSSELKLLADVYLGKPRTHVIQKGESLSEIAIQYYGNVEYWRELALVNMAPDPNLIWVGEEILVPDRETIVALNQAKTLSTVKDLVIQQELALENHSPRQQPDAVTEPEETQPIAEEFSEPVQTVQPTLPTARTETAESSSNWVLWLAVFLIACGVIGFWWMRSNRQKVVLVKPRTPKTADPAAARRQTDATDTANGNGTYRRPVTPQRREVAVLDKN